MRRVAAVDCGTNSIRLLVAEATGDPAAPLAELHREMRVVRLGQGVDRTGRFAPDALARTLAACRDYARVVRDLDVGAVRFVATSATRDAQDRDAFVAGVREALGVAPEVVSGQEEAHLSFRGATGELAGGPHRGPYLVVDIGGGSTEFVLGDERVRAARSVDVGCVRLTERHLHDDPPTPAQVGAARADVEAAVELAAAAVPLRGAGTLVGLAGSVTTVAAAALDLPAYDSARIHHARVPAARVHEVAERLLAMTRAQRAALPYMHPGRVDVIGAGALVLSLVVERTGADAVVASEHDILDGIALGLLA